MKGWLVILLFVAGCGPQYTREQAEACNTVWDAANTFHNAVFDAVTTGSPAHMRETVLPVLPALIERLKSYPPGSTGADEEVKGLLATAIALQGQVPAVADSATREEVETVFEPIDLWYQALVRKCEFIDQHLASPSVPSPTPFPAGWTSASSSGGVSVG